MNVTKTRPPKPKVKANPMSTTDVAGVGLDNYKFGFHDDIKPVYTSPKGLSEDIVRENSRQKD